MLKRIDEKIKALAGFLNIDEKEITPCDYMPCQFRTADGDFYAVCTENQAKKLASDFIRESVWSFNADFIVDNCGIFDGLDKKEYLNATKSLAKMQAELCENAQDFIKALIDGTCGMDVFIENAINEDGLAHFIAFYDGVEHENAGYKIYQTC